MAASDGAGLPPRGAFPGASPATPTTRSRCPPPPRSPSKPSSNPSFAWPTSAWRAAAAKQAREFLALYYDQVDAEDLGARAPEDLYGAGMAHLAFARRFATGTPKLRVYNPRTEEHGWSSPHTVVEIVNDDMPFLVDSVTMELNRQGRTLHLLVHPLVKTVRDEEGDLASFAPAGRDGARESLIHVEVDRESDPARLKALGDGLLAVLADVRAAVEDWKPMREAMQAIVDELARPPEGLDAADVEETRAFLAWALADNFTFIGFREYELDADDGEDQLRIVPRSGLGVLREPRLGGISQSFRELPAAIRALAREPRLLVLTKANSRATVHRPGYLDYVGVKRFDAAGRVVGERRFVGLYTSSAYHADPRDIPLLRRKVARVLERPASRRRATGTRTSCPCCTPIRATSSSRSTSARSSRSPWASCAWATGGARASSCGATSTGASSPASSTCRARTTTPTCA